MGYHIKSVPEHFCADGTPKRVLALDGGGLRGMVTLGILARIEDLLRKRHGNDSNFRLCHYFDLIAGTSTGAIIAAALAQGWTVAEIVDMYRSLGKSVFEKNFWDFGIFRSKYQEGRLIRALKVAFKPNVVLGGDQVKTGLLVMMKRLDTGSPWPVGNNPNGRYFEDRLKPDGSITLGNGSYLLWEVVRASTAAPTYFEPQSITISGAKGQPPVLGEFVDGGVSPYNNPALQALMYVTLDGYRVNWSKGADQLLLVSVGTGRGKANPRNKWMAAKHAVNALMSVIEDGMAQTETLLQWISSSPTARNIDRELGNLGSDLLTQSAVMTYLRYDVDLSKAENFDGGIIPDDISEMDVPRNINLLHQMGIHAGEHEVLEEHFPTGFDLAASDRAGA